MGLRGGGSWEVKKFPHPNELLILAYCENDKNWAYGLKGSKNFFAHPNYLLIWSHSENLVKIDLNLVKFG